MTLIVDASVAVKWLLLEDGTEAAKRLIADELLAAPDLLFIECANVLRTKRRRGLLSAEDVAEAFIVLESVPLRGVPIRPHVSAAHTIASELDCSAYDALYLAVALAERSLLVTADAKFARAVSAHPVYRSSLMRLES
ncbi:MAG TPA: type II toxin-antitoxin system VapC family toxin [Caulobacteraceae bacterium]|nr:type II toxin-antitoxin system VapC family toxin [Caulobacteraceae bacterium]